ncbi:MAG: hypothetical protein KDK70_20055 [Myxococcales bacterium]|nr:hypothetical protein [Myxococcales bacterium]
MRTSLKFLLPSLAFAAPLAWAGAAHAGLGACGDIHVEASAECEVRVGAECEASCEPVAFEAQCAADLHASCDGQCQGQITAGCNATCETDCRGQCDVNPATFDCKGSCFAEGRSSCEGRCADSECQASCEATLEAECSGQCDLVDPGSATCEGQCQASCEGYCQAEANVDCQIECQAGGYVDCQSQLSGGCRAECSKPEGALFCDSQYVDHGGNLEECVESLRALLNIEVSGYAEGSCGNGRCEGEAGGSISCSVAPDGRTTLGLGTLALLVLGIGRRRRR